MILISFFIGAILPLRVDSQIAEDQQGPSHLYTSTSVFLANLESRYLHQCPKLRAIILQYKLPLIILNNRMTPRHRNIRDPDIAIMSPAEPHVILIIERYQMQAILVLVIAIRLQRDKRRLHVLNRQQVHPLLLHHDSGRHRTSRNLAGE